MVTFLGTKMPRVFFYNFIVPFLHIIGIYSTVGMQHNTNFYSIRISRFFETRMFFLEVSKIVQNRGPLPQDLWQAVFNGSYIYL